MRLEIITPDKKIFDGHVNLVQLPGISGSFEILKNHTALISSLKKGKIKIENVQKQVEFFEVNGGVVEVLNNEIVVLAE